MKLSRGFMIPFFAQSAMSSMAGGVAMSGRLVRAETFTLSCWAWSRIVRRWTLMPVESWKGFNTFLYASSSWPPQADQTVTSVADGVGWAPPPTEQPATRSKAPSPSAIPRELSLPKMSAISAKSSRFSTAGSGRFPDRLDANDAIRRTFADSAVRDGRDGLAHCQSSHLVVIASKQSLFALGVEQVQRAGVQAEPDRVARCHLHPRIHPRGDRVASHL